MTVRNYQDFSPLIPDSAYVDAAAIVIGNVTFGERVSVWPGCVIRGDVNRIEIGDNTNIQDLSVLHVNSEGPDHAGSQLSLGRSITVGHRVILHGCRIDDLCLIGMGAIIMDDAHLESRVLLAAGSLVPAGKVLEGGHLWRGSPARKVRELTQEELDYFEYSADHYARLAERHRNRS
jgi:carbonic anhydrase/acetyltransferase-like protein (isoleucine patch superfamily)